MRSKKRFQMSRSSIVEPLLSYLTRAVESALTISIVVMVVSIFLQVVARMVIKSPLLWSEELGRFIFIWMIFLSSGLAVRTRTHFQIEFFAQLFPDRFARYFDVLTDVSILAFSSYLLWYGTSLTILTMGQLSPAMRIPIGYAYMALPASGFVMVVYSFVSLIDNLLGRKR